MRKFFDLIRIWLFDGWNTLEEWWISLGWEVVVLRNIAKTLLIALLWVLVRRLIVAPISRLMRHPRQRYGVRKVGNAIAGVLAIVATGIVWFQTAGQDWMQFLGIFSAGLAVALKDPLLNVFGWVYISIREPFDVKDRIEVFFPDHRIRGDVIDIRLSMFSLLEVGNWVDAEQSTGRIIHLPNSCVFNHPLANYTQGFRYIWNEIAVTVTFESNWERAHAILTRIVSEHSKEAVREAQNQVHETSTRFMVYYTRFTPIVWVSVIDIGVTLTMRYLCDTRRRRSSEHALWSAVLRAFEKHNDIDFAYPTTRFYDNADEGKRPLRAEPNAPAATIHTPPGRSRTVPNALPSAPPRPAAAAPPPGMPAVPTVSSTTSPPEAPVELAPSAPPPIGTGVRKVSMPTPPQEEESAFAGLGHLVTSNHLEEETGIWDLKKLRELAAEYESGQVPPQTPSAEPGSDGDKKSKS